MAHSAGTSAQVKDAGGGGLGPPKGGISPFANPKQFVDLIEMLELVGTPAEKRNWRGIFIAILVILIVLGLIIVAVILVTPEEVDVIIGDPFVFDDMFNKDFQPRYFNAKWSAEEDVYTYRSKEGEIMEYDVTLNETSVVMSNTTFRELDSDVYFVSPDRQFVLIAYQIDLVNRHSFLAKYKIFSRNSDDPKERLSDFPVSMRDEWKDTKLQYAGWSATGHSLTFISNNNLYHQKDPQRSPTQITSTTEDQIYIRNGIADWLYEEEILSTHVAHWWSPDNKYIAYATFDDSNVPRYQFPRYDDELYGSIEEVSYPKAGDKRPDINPKVTLTIVGTGNPDITRALSPPPEFKDMDIYMSRVQWQDETTLMVIWLNRAQNTTIVSLCDAVSGSCYTNLIEKTKGTGWITLPTPRIIEGGKSYLARLSGRDGSHGYWKHIALVIANPREVPGRKSFVTQGPFDVLDIVGYNEDTKHIYYLSNYIPRIDMIDPRKRHLYRIKLSGDADVSTTPECMTCDGPKTCQYVSASFSPSGHHYILDCLGPAIPTYTLKSTMDDREIVVEDNTDIAARLEKKAMPIVEYVEIEHPTEGHLIWAKIMIPSTLNRDHITQYPTLVATYAAPGTQRVTYQFIVGWSTVLVSSLNVIHIEIDGRGSLGRGDEWLHMLYQQLGTMEVEDQIVAARYLADRYEFIDKARVAIWGWSYGGFVTTHALGDETKVFTCGIAVAPVTDWRYYDTAYTERYMGLSDQEENFRGYDNANVSRKAANFVGKKLMVVHGTADDNVHFQHSANFIRVLTKAGVEYRIQIYTDKKHSLRGPKTSRHLYRTMTSYLQQTCWRGGRPHNPSRDPSPEEEEAMLYYGCKS